MIDLGLHLSPDRIILATTGGTIEFPPDLHPLPTTNTRIIALSENDLALILAMLDEGRHDFVPISLVVADNIVVPNKINSDYELGELVTIGQFVNRPVVYSGNIDEQDSYPFLPQRARELLAERIAIAREHLMVDLTDLLTTINASLSLIEEHTERQADAQERIATAVETQANGEGLDAIAENIGLLLPLVAAI